MLSVSDSTSSIPSLWNFATERYAREGVAPLCLRLQDEYGFDVNLLLFCCWYGAHYGAVDSTLMQSLFDYSRDWNNNAVQPVRETRNWLRALIENSQGDEALLGQLREKVKEVELECERHQLEALETQARGVQPAQTSSDAEESSWGNLELLRQQMTADEAAIDDLLRELLRLVGD